MLEAAHQTVARRARKLKHGTSSAPGRSAWIGFVAQSRSAPIGFVAPRRSARIGFVARGRFAPIGFVEMAARRPLAGFTLIELLVVLAIVALLLTIATPRYIHHVERARETTLRSSLKVMRASIDKFYGDQGRFPESLDELVSRNYLHDVPLDPVTDKRDTWIVVNEAEMRSLSESAAAGAAGGASTRAENTSANASTPPAQTKGVADVHSGATGNASDGSAFKDW